MMMLSTLLIALITALDIRRERNIFYADLEKRGTQLTETLHDVLADRLYFSDVDALRDVTQYLGQQLDITYIKIFDSQGRVLAASEERDYPTGITGDELVLNALRGGHQGAQFAIDRLEVISPLTAGAETLGAIQFGFDSDPLDDEIRQIVFQHIWQGLILIFVGLVISYSIARYTTRPLKALAETAQDIGSGNLDVTVPRRGPKETMALGIALEQMRAELQRLYSGLEQQVEERTQELSKANVELKNEVQERLRAEEELGRSTQRLRTALDTSSVVLWERDLKTGKISASGAVNSLSGAKFNPGTVAFEDFLDTVHPDDRELITKANALAIEQGILKDSEFRVNLPNGDIRWMARRGTVFHDEAGVPSRMVGVNYDITERKPAEQELRESAERFRRMSEAEAIAINDQGVILDANQAMAAMYGYSIRDLIGMHVMDLASPESRELVRTNALSGSRKPYEAVGLRKDGSTFIAEVFGKSITYQGRTARITVIHDATDRRQAEEDVRRQASAVEATQDSVIIVDMEGRLLFVNSAAERVRGYEPGEMVGISMTEFVPPSLVDNTGSGMFDLIVREGSWSGETRSLRKDGSELPISPNPPMEGVRTAEGGG